MIKSKKVKIQIRNISSLTKHLVSNDLKVDGRGYDISENNGKYLVERVKPNLKDASLHKHSYKALISKSPIDEDQHFEMEVVPKDGVKDTISLLLVGLSLVVLYLLFNALFVETKLPYFSFIIGALILLIFLRMYLFVDKIKGGMYYFVEDLRRDINLF